MPDISPPGLIGGARLRFDVTGDTGPAIVQLHGLTSSRLRDEVLGLDMTSELRARGSRSGFRILRYDARGHGRSSGQADPPSYEWPRLAEDLLHLLDHVFPGESVHGVGPSMGAATQLYAATFEPARFASLSLLVPPTAWETRRVRAAVYRANADIVEQLGLQEMVDRDIHRAPPAAPAAPTTSPDVTAELLPSVLRGAALSDLPDRGRMRGLPVPTLILAWIGDPGHPESTANELHRLLPSCSLTLARTPEDVERWPTLVQGHVQRHDRGLVTSPPTGTPVGPTQTPPAAPNAPSARLPSP